MDCVGCLKEWIHEDIFAMLGTISSACAVHTLHIASMLSLGLYEMSESYLYGAINMQLTQRHQFRLLDGYSTMGDSYACNRSIVPKVDRYLSFEACDSYCTSLFLNLRPSMRLLIETDHLKSCPLSLLTCYHRQHVDETERSLM
jgi:hypothetical protein